MKVSKRQLRRIIREEKVRVLTEQRVRRLVRRRLLEQQGAALVVNYDSSGMSYTDPTTGKVVAPEEILDYNALGDDEFMKQSGEMVAAAAAQAGITQIDDAERGMMSVDEFVQLMSAGGGAGASEEVPSEVETVAAAAGWAWDPESRTWKQT